MLKLRLIPSISGKATKIDAVLDGELLHSVIYGFDGDFLPSDSSLGNVALLAFLPFAMQRGIDMSIEANVDEDLLAQTDESQDAWSRWHPNVFSRIEVHSDGTNAQTSPLSKKAITAFSGGLDASYALFAHKKKLVGRRSLDLHAAVLVHGFDIPLDKPEWFFNAKKRAEEVTKSFDLPLITVRTNWRELQTPWGQTFIFGMASVMHHFKGMYDYGVIASDESYENEVLGWGSNSITNPLVSGPSFPIRFTGAGLSRTQKAEVVSAKEAFLRNIRVCWERPDLPNNCGECEKCIRTKLNFLANGVEYVPALGCPVTAQQVSKVTIPNIAILNFYKEMAALPWYSRSDIKYALQEITERGVVQKSKFERRLGKYKKSLRKRGLWF